MKPSIDCKAIENCAISAREGHCAAAVGSKLFVFGGVCKHGDCVKEQNDLWCFDSGK